MNHLPTHRASDPVAVDTDHAPAPVADPSPTPADHGADHDAATTHAAAAGTPRRHLVAVPALAASLGSDGEEGSLVAEYGLLAVVAATVAGVLISWATGGALADFFGALLSHARSLVIQ